MSEAEENRFVRMRRAIEKVVETQIATLDPPETNAALVRLVEQGYKREEAIRMIGYVVGLEFFQAVGPDGGYDHARFVERLAALPRLPFDRPRESGEKKN